MLARTTKMTRVFPVNGSRRDSSTVPQKAIHVLVCEQPRHIPPRRTVTSSPYTFDTCSVESYSMRQNRSYWIQLRISVSLHSPGCSLCNEWVSVGFLYISFFFRLSDDLLVVHQLRANESLTISDSTADHHDSSLKRPASSLSFPRQPP